MFFIIKNNTNHIKSKKYLKYILILSYNNIFYFNKLYL